MFIREKEVNFSDYNVKFLLAFLFAVILPFLMVSTLIINISFNIIFFPFTVIHEVGHFIVAILLFPEQNPQLKLLTFKEGLKCGCVTLGGLEISWGTIILLLSGSVLVILTVTMGMCILSRKNNKLNPYIQKYLLFGLLCDLPNLFPTYPSEGVVTDGFRTWLFLHDLINLPYPTPQFSLIFTAIASVIIFYSSFYLGLFLFEILLNSVGKWQNQSIYPSVS